jgi:copper chaperone CopZ
MFSQKPAPSNRKRLRWASAQKPTSEVSWELLFASPRGPACRSLAHTRMNIQSHPEQQTGILRIIDGIQSDEKAHAIQACLEVLRGVQGVEVIGAVVRIRFDPQIVTEQRFYEAVEIAGFQANGFQTAT